MSVTRNTAEQSPPEHLRCRHCKTMLPLYATFCRTCGARVEKDASNLHAQDSPGMVELYRITALICRRPYIQLFLAIDNMHQRPVVIRDIDMSSLNEEQRTLAIEVAQHEFDLLRCQRSDDVMSVINLHYFQEHLFVVAGTPFTIHNQGENSVPWYTLQDLLQSGVGLPDELVAITWAYQLCRALAHLHRDQIVIGDLDPYAIIVSDNSYYGTPALMVSWLPLPIRNLLPRTSVITNANSFRAPEVLLNCVEPCADIYSVGAILYLLLTGTSPEEPTLHVHRSLRSPREFNSQISSRVEEVVMRALSIESANRYQSADEMSEALLELCASTQSARTETLVLQNRKEKQGVRERAARVEVNKNLPVTDDLDQMTISVDPKIVPQAWRHLSKRASGRSGVENEQCRVSIVDTLKQEEHKKVNHEQKEQEQDEYNMEDLKERKQEEEPELALEEDKPEEPEEALEEDKPEEEPELALEEDKPEEPEEALEQLPIVVLSPSIQKGVLVNGFLPKPVSLSTQVQPQSTTGDSKMVQLLRERLSGILPALGLSGGGGNATSVSLQGQTVTDDEKSFLKQLQRFFLGEQQRNTKAVALIETPFRVQPNQNYTVRIHLLGRDIPIASPGAKENAPLAGLSALAQGELARIEIRSALYQNYAYIVQQANVRVPGRGYAAEVTMPMQSLMRGSSGRRDRLHIFFMDEAGHPLYEKPFVIELFISPLVQFGREGRNVLAIPL